MQLKLITNKQLINFKPEIILSKYPETFVKFGNPKSPTMVSQDKPKNRSIINLFQLAF